VTLKATFAVWNLSTSRILGNTACFVCYMFTRESESAHGL